MAKPRNTTGSSPGLRGAIKDFVGAVSSYAAPKSITQAEARRRMQEEAALGRLRNAQTTDSNN